MSWRSILQPLFELPPDWRERTVLASTAGDLSFGELRADMLRFAFWLRARGGVGPGDRVALCLPKSVAAVQAIYGILASGAAYVPLQFRGPPARLRAILDSIRPKLLLTTAETATRLAADGEGATVPPVQAIEGGEDGRGFERLWAKLPAAQSLAPVRPDELAAIYFTSGSSGEPKGVMLSHRSLAATVDWVRQTRAQRAADWLINNSGLHYAASLELFFPIASGCRIFLLSDPEAMLPDYVAQVLERERVTHVTVTATALRLLLEHGDLDRLRLEDLRLVEFFGEPLPIATLSRIMAALPKAEFVNIYGATEAYRMAHFFVPRPIPHDMHALPIGHPCPQYDVTLRDDRGEEVPRGEVGEICVAGPQVMSGYWNDPELSASKRLDGRPDSYRTGDFALVGADGLLRLIGRRDQVVKIRGHRFDLGEVEAVLKLHPAVRDAAAFAVPVRQDETEVRAAVLVDDDRDLATNLRRLCADRLPGFARPGRIAVLRRFPTLSTGKVDRQALKALVSAA